MVDYFLKYNYFSILKNYILKDPLCDWFEITKNEGWTDKFIYPPYKFKMADLFIINFLQPISTLMMLVAAFAKKDFLLDAYKEAKKKKYRFYSYGDSMMII